jgi:hypothetical protein
VAQSEGAGAVKYFYDCEFLEDGRSVELISIGIVAEEDGRAYHAVNWDAPWKRIAQESLLAMNVAPSLPRLRGVRRLQAGRRNRLAVDFGDPLMKRRARIADDVRTFLLAGGPDPELWADYGAYQHVALCKLFGSMIDLPPGMPTWTHDLRGLVEQAGNPDLPGQPAGPHTALEDARHVKALYDLLTTEVAPSA